MTDDERLELVRGLHTRGLGSVVLAVTGGGALAIGDLLTVPGASNTVLEVCVPYAEAALAELLGGPPEQAVSEATAAALALVCQRRAVLVAHDGAGGAEAGSRARRVGVACSATRASVRPKRGPHRAHVALSDGATTVVWSLVLDKGARSRWQEDRLVSDLLLAVLGRGCGVETSWPALRPGDRLSGG
jgi:nicotinamide mononucleotide (NMN) deamidase PncC